MILINKKSVPSQCILKPPYLKIHALTHSVSFELKLISTIAVKYERSNKLYIFNFFPVKKKKKPKLLNKFDKSIKAELDAAEKLRKKVSFECFTQSLNGGHE